MVAAHQAVFIRKGWDTPRHIKCFLWIDAKVVLRWLTQYNIKETFVHNRVKQIRELLQDSDTTIKYVPSELNPADLITKEQDATKFMSNSAWFDGPAFLNRDSDWPTTEDTYTLYPDGCDEKISNYKLSVRIAKQTSFLNFFSGRKFTSSLRILAMLQRIAKLTSFKIFATDSMLTKQEIDQAKTTCISIMQREMFPTELQSLEDNTKVKTSNKKFNLYMDKGVIKCEGRLTNLHDPDIQNNPILVDGGHPVTRSFIEHYHRHYNCSSKRYTLNKVRTMIDGPNVKKTVDSVCRSCYVCKLIRSTPYSYPKIPPLPKERLIARTPFAVCGVDYSGPHQVRQGRGKAKIWIALFTCMVSRAIYLHIVPDLTADSFIGALRALAWTYQQPQVLMSDNATCFVAANKILAELKNRLDVQNELSAKGIQWIFTPTNAPWFGAIYERMIGTLKREMVKMLGGLVLTYFELDLHLKEITGIINNRPLTAVGSEDVITPSNIITGRSNTDHNILEVSATHDILQEAMIEKNKIPQLFKDTERRKNVFWTHFKQQYLESLKFTSKPSDRTPGLTPQVGDVVIIYDSNEHKLFWSKGLILELIPSDDGHIRKAKVKINKKVSIKAVNHLYPLEARAEEAIEQYQKSKDLNTFTFEGFTQDQQGLNQSRIELLRKSMATSVPT